MDGNRKKTIIGLIAIVIAMIFGLFSCRGCTNETPEKAGGEETPAVTAEQDESGKENTEEGMCTITIDNGAASANTDQAVNGLHVYDPASADMEDFISGAEVPKGTKISVYVYNLASPVALKIVHNGEVIADKTYPIMQAFVDDDKVEFFDIVLEGDLTVTTKALSAEEKTESAVSIKNENLASVTIGNEIVHDGSTVRNGTYDFTVQRKDADVTVTMKKGGVTVGTAELTEQNPSYTFSDVNVDGSDISFSFRKKGEKETGYKVTIQNRVKGADAVLTVGYVDDSSGTPKAVDIVSGRTYEAGLMIGVRAMNRSSSRLKITAYTAGGSVIKSVTVDPRKGSEDGANGFYFDLNSNTRIVLDYAGGGSEATPSPTPSAAPGTKECTITINNYAASANTDEAVNALHVYTGDNDDYKSGDKVPAGTKVTMFVYNYASPVRLVVEHNGKVIKNAVYQKIRPFEDDDKIEMIDVVLEGDLKVSAYVEGTQPSPTPKPTPSPTPSPTPGTDTKQYKVTVDDNVKDQNVTFTVGYVDMTGDTPKQVLIESGKKYDEGLMIGARVMNDSGYDVKLTVYEGNEVSHTAVIKAAEADGYYVESLKADTRFVLEKAEEETKQYTVTVEDKVNDENVTFTVGYVDMTGDTPKQVLIESGKKYDEGLMIGARVMNDSEADVKLTVYEGNKASHTAVIKAGEADGYYVESLKADTRFVLEPSEAQDEMCTITIEDGAASANTDEAVNAVHVYTGNEDDYKSGAKVAKGTEVTVYVYNYASPVRLIIEHNGEVIKDKVYDMIVPFESDDDIEFIDITLEGDLKVTTEVAEKPEEKKQYAVTAEDKVNDENVTFTVGYLDMTGDTPKQVLIESGKKYDEGLTVGGRVMNDSEKDVIFTVYEGTEVSHTATVKAGEADGYYVEALKADTRFVLEPAEKKQYTVTIEDKVNDENVSLNVMWMDADNNYGDITSGDSLEEGLNIFAQIINSASYPVKVTIYAEDKELESSEVTPDDMFGGAGPVELKQNLRIVMEKAEAQDEMCTITIEDGAASANTDEAVNAVHVYTGNEDDYKSGAKVEKGTEVTVYVYNYASPVRLIIEHNGEVIKDKVYDMIVPFESDDDIEFIDITLEGDLKVTTEVAEKPVPEKKTYTVTLSGDGAEDAIVYNEDYDFVKNGDSIEEGTHSFHVTNEGYVDGLEDADVTLKVGGSQIGETKKIGGSGADYEDIDVSGDVEIVISYPRQPEEKKQYTVTVEDNVKDENVAFTVGYVDMTGDTPKQVLVESGKKYDEGLMIGARVMNDSENDVVLTVTEGGKTTHTAAVKAGEADGYYVESLNADTVFTIEKAKAEEPEKKTYKVTLSGDGAEDAIIYNEEYDFVRNGDLIEEGTHTFLVTNEGYVDGLEEASVTLKIGGKQIGETKKIGDSGAEYADVNVAGDVEIIIQYPEQSEPEVPEKKQYTVTLKNSTDDSKVTFTVGYIDDSGKTPKQVLIESGKKYDEGLMIGARVVNESESDVILTVTEGGKVTHTATVKAGDADGYYVESLSADTVFTVEKAKAEEPAEKTYTLTLAGNAAAEATVYNEAYDLVKNGDTLEEGDHSFYVYNENYVDGLENAEVTLTVGGKQIGEVKTIGFQGAEFENIAVTGNVVITIALPEESEGN